MAGLNKVMLIGHLGADPEKRSLNNGGSVVNFRIATSENWKDRDGNRQERTEWHNVVIFNEGLGDIAAKYLRKGSKCYVEGQLQTRKWKDQSGTDRYTTEVVLQKFRGEIVLLDSKEDNGGRGERRREYDDSGRDSGRNQRGDQGDLGYDADQGGRGGYNREDRQERPRQEPAAFDDDLDDDVPF